MEEDTFFEAPEYPFFERLKKCLVLFVRRSIGLFVVLLLVRISEISFNYYLLHPKETLLTLIAEGTISTSIYFFKSLFFLFIIYAVLFFLHINKKNLKVYNLVLFAIYLLIELLLSKYFFSTGLLLGDEIFTKKNILFDVFSFNAYWLLAIVVSWGLLWLAVQYVAKLIPLFNYIYGVLIIVIAGILVLFNVSALPNNDNAENFKIETSKSAYFFNKTYDYLFDSEPEVDIYNQNYFD